jgi:hypothetical protein
MSKSRGLDRPGAMELAIKRLHQGMGLVAVAQEVGVSTGIISALAIVTHAGVDRVQLSLAQIAQRRAVARLLGERLARPDSPVVTALGLGQSSLANLALVWRKTKAWRRGLAKRRAT